MAMGEEEGERETEQERESEVAKRVMGDYRVSVVGEEK